MSKLKKDSVKRTVNKKRRSQLEYFGKAAAVIAGMSIIPSLTSGAVSFKKGTAGASTLFLDDAGKVGVGTITPGVKLDVIGSGSFGLATRYSGAQAGTLNLSEQTTAARTGPQAWIQFHNSGAEESFLRLAKANRTLEIGDSQGAGCGLAIMNPAATARAITLTPGGVITATQVFGAVWNDIADYLETENEVTVEFGKVYVRDRNGKTRVSQKRCEQGILGIASDTFGMSVGKKGKGKKEIPIALAGIVLAHVDKEYASGTALTSTKNGRLTKMRFCEKLFFPERIVACFYKSEKAKKWNGVIVNHRYWVKVKG